MTDAAEGVHDEGNENTQLQDMLQWLVQKKQQSAEPICSPEYTKLESDIERITERITRLREEEAKRKYHLNLLANKYEMIKAEIDLIELEKKRAEKKEATTLPTLLVAKYQDRDMVLAERKKLEEEVLRANLYGRSKKLSREEERLIRKQIRDTVTNYAIVDYSPSTDKSHVEQYNNKWRHLLLNYAHILESLIDESDDPAHEKIDPQTRAALLLRLDRFEKQVVDSKQAMDENCLKLDEVLADLKVDQHEALDRGYHITEEDIIAGSSNPEKLPGVLSYSLYMFDKDSEFIKNPELPKVFDSACSLINDTINRIIVDQNIEKKELEAMLQPYFIALAFITTYIGYNEFFYHAEYPESASNSMMLKAQVTLFDHMNIKDDELKQKDQWKSHLRLLYGLMRFNLEANYRQPIIRSKDFAKSCVSVYLNRQEYFLDDKLEFEVRTITTGLLLFCATNYDEFFDLEKDNIVQISIEDSLVDELPTLQYLAMALMLAVGSPDQYRKRKPVVTKLVAKLEERFSSNPVWK